MEKILRKQYVGVIKEINDEERTVTGYITTNAKDRDGEIVLPEGIDLANYRKNPVVMWAHNYRELPIGKNLWVKQDDKGLIAKTQFADTQFAFDVFNLMKGGFLNAFSIGFKPIEWIDGDGDKEPRRTFKKSELWEYSVVPIPANPEALLLAQAKGIIKDKDLISDLHLKPEPEVTENYIRIRVEDPDKFVDTSFRTIIISAEQGIKAVIGKYKADPDGSTHIQSYLFEKDKWDVARAQAWVREHKPKMQINFTADNLYQFSIGEKVGVNYPDFNDEKWFNLPEKDEIDGTKIIEEIIVELIKRTPEEMITYFTTEFQVKIEELKNQIAELKLTQEKPKDNIVPIFTGKEETPIEKGEYQSKNINITKEQFGEVMKQVTESIKEVMNQKVKEFISAEIKYQRGTVD